MVKLDFYAGLTVSLIALALLFHFPPFGSRSVSSKGKLHHIGWCPKNHQFGRSKHSSLSTGSMAEGVEEFYSIWAMPKGSIAEQLQREVDYLATQHGAPKFPPHVTILGDIKGPKEDVLRTAEQLAQGTKEYRITFLNVTKGTFYYQCVYLLGSPDEPTMAAAQRARDLFKMKTGPYMPHMSLLYADFTDEQKSKVVQQEIDRLYGPNSSWGTLLTESSFLVDSFAVWYTPTVDKSCASWCKVGEFSLKK